MAERRKIYISIGEWQYKRKHQEYYTGYVIGVGYAFLAEKVLVQNHRSNQTSYFYQCQMPDSNPHLFQYKVLKEQHLDTSKEAIKKSVPATAAKEENLFWSADVRTAAWGAQNLQAALSIGEYKRGSINISTNAVRFTTRNDILNETKGWKGEGTQVNAFRHILWQSYITNKHGYEIASQVGNVHEANPNVDITQRRFSSLLEADQVIDLLNNKIGRQIGASESKNVKMNTMALLVLDTFYEEGFYTAVKSNDGTFYIDRTKITDEQYEQLKKIFKEVNVYGRTEKEQEKQDKIDREKLEQLQMTWGTMK